MWKKALLVVLLIVLFLVPFAVRRIYYYDGTYEPGEVTRPDLEKIQAIQKHHKIVALDLTTIVKDAFSSLTPLMEEKGIQHQLDLESFPIPIKGNPDHLTQVVVNLSYKGRSRLAILAYCLADVERTGFKE